MPPLWPSTLSGSQTGGLEPGLGMGHGAVPRMVSFGDMPASRAATSVNGLNDEPV